MVRADYVYGVMDGVVCIIDLNRGGTSVTNDIENVVQEILKEKQLSPNTPIIYQDSMLIWDGWNHITQNFIHIGENSLSKALLKIKEKI